MNALMHGLLARPRLVLATALLLALSGLFAWFNMPRQEDPTMPDRFGIIVTTYPGADAEAVERLVTTPLEEELVEVDEVKRVSSTSRTDVSVIRVEFEDAVVDTDKGWDDVRRAMESAAEESGSRPVKCTPRPTCPNGPKGDREGRARPGGRRSRTGQTGGARSEPRGAHGTGSDPARSFSTKGCPSPGASGTSSGSTPVRGLV